MMKLFRKIADWVVIGIGNIHWGYRNGLSDDELTHIKSLLTKDYYIILTHRDNHLSTFFVGLAYELRR